MTDNTAHQFRKLPAVIWAMQFRTNNEGGTPNMDAVVNWINQGKMVDDMHAWHNGTNIFIQTLEGTMRAEVGDLIIKGVKGEFYPCKKEIFNETYEAL